MIIREINKGENVLFEPEDSRERKYLEAFPGLLREGLHFFSPGKPRIIQNLYARISKYIKPANIRYTPLVQDMLKSYSSLTSLPSEFSFHTPPLPHQLQALEFLYTQGSAGLLLDPGLGKTKVILDYIYLKGFKKSLIICPKPLLYVWKEEVAKHRPELSVYCIQTTDWESEGEEIAKADVVVTNYSKAVILLENLQRIKLDFLGLDEGLIKDYTTDRTIAITKLGRGVPHKCVMSGTLVNNSPLDCFAPVRFIEPAVIGEGVTRFKARYAITAKQNQHILIGFRDTPEIQSIIASCCIVMRKAEWLKYLPAKVFHTEKVHISGDAAECYNNLVSNWMFSHEGFDFEFDNPLPRASKLIQIANGFVYHLEKKDEEGEDDETDELTEIEGGEPKKVAKTKAKGKNKPVRTTLFFQDQPKINALHEVITNPEKLDNRRAILWFNFQAELEIIEKYLKKSGYTYLVVKGGDKEIGDKIHKFNTDPSIRFLVGQAKTINYGATILGKQKGSGSRKDDEDLQVTEFSESISDEIFYSLNFSLEVFLQQQDRIHRIGQQKVCHYWMLVTNSCIETKICKAIETKMSISRALLIDFSKELQLV